MAEAPRMFAMTPREIALLIQAHRARAWRREWEIWLLARHAALAFHAPDRLPPPPPAPASAPMTADDMKQRLLAWRGKDASS
ncbi:MAG: hypothetical protein IKP32_00685 [Clostridia bacterium]|nr:hypothetical protein [Clostridia bacterium]